MTQETCPPQTTRLIRIKNRRGLHARAAAKIARLAESFECEITVTHGDRCVSALSLMGLLMLAAPMGTQLKLIAQGQDSPEALNQLEELIGNKFDEKD